MPGESHVQHRFTIPRWIAILLGIFLWLVLIPVAHGVVPWAISTLMPRFGWVDGKPGIWNWLGLIPLPVAIALLAWVLVVGIRQTPKRIRPGLTPSFLMMDGPYRFTRNPMYVAELGLWIGWAIFFGSLAVLIVSLAMYSIVNWVILPREERTLERVFGQSYLEFKNAVPRWL